MQECRRRGHTRHISLVGSAFNASSSWKAVIISRSARFSSASLPRAPTGHPATGDPATGDPATGHPASQALDACDGGLRCRCPLRP
jgi:hypothetical protein